MNMDKDYYSVNEFANKLGVHPNTIRRAIKTNRISALKIGKAKNSILRIAVSELIRMAEFDLEEIIEREVEKRLKARLDV